MTEHDDDTMPEAPGRVEAAPHQCRADALLLGRRHHRQRRQRQRIVGPFSVANHDPRKEDVPDEPVSLVESDELKSGMYAGDRRSASTSRASSSRPNASEWTLKIAGPSPGDSTRIVGIGPYSRT